MTPGFQLQRERGLGQLISDSFSIVTSNWTNLALMAAPAIVIDLLISLIGLAAHTQGMKAVVSLLSFPIDLIAFQLVGGAIAGALPSLETGKLISANEALNNASDHLGALVSAAVRSSIIVVLFIFTIIGSPFGIYRLIRWLFVPQAIMLDGQSSATALDYSAALVQGHWWVTFGRLLGVGVLAAIPLGIVSFGVAATLPAVIGLFVTAILSAFATPYTVVATTLMYYDLKVRKVSYDSSPA